MGNTSAGLKNKVKSIFGIPTIGAHKTGAGVVHGQCLQESLQSSLKYYQAVAQAAHRVVTTITVLVVRVAIMA